MGFKVQITLEKDGKKATLATIENIDVVEQVADEQKATFRFHVEGATTQTMGGGAVLMVLDKIPAIKKIFDAAPAKSSAVQGIAMPVAMPVALPEPVKDAPNAAPEAAPNTEAK
jgi:hypothetical protein